MLAKKKKINIHKIIKKKILSWDQVKDKVPVVKKAGMKYFEINKIVKCTI